MSFRDSDTACLIAVHFSLGLPADERCAILAAMQPHLHHIHHGVNSLVEIHLQLAAATAEGYRRFGLHDTAILDLVQESSLRAAWADAGHPPL